MKLGVLFPQSDHLGPADVKRYAQGVEELGFDHVMIYDHVLGADPTAHPEFAGPWSFTYEDEIHEPMVLYGYLAAVAPSLELVTGILIAPQRQTALLAKQAVELDVLTEGKFRLGIGQGWNRVEYEALGVPWQERGRRLEEQVELMRRLWSERVISFDGSYHVVNAAGLNPLPGRGRIPVWLGGSSEPALRRAARIGDGFFPQNPLEGGWDVTLDRMREWREEAGLDPADFGIEARLNALVGTPDDWHAGAEEWRQLGATHLAVATFRGDVKGVDAHLERLALAKEAVLG